MLHADRGSAEELMLGGLTIGSIAIPLSSVRLTAEFEHGAVNTTALRESDKIS